ncbi:MAG: PIG-L family deacetylase [Acidobacteriaceae bacterium]|nr:PIG-L family deacetylase [Acidobacteriaceae bacterium]
MKYQRLSRLRAVFVTLLLTLSHLAAAGTLHDPANLSGERVPAQLDGQATPLSPRAAALRHTLAKLRTRASLMLIVAHPDDEDGGMLSYESIGNGGRVAMLTLTRGEGGQNSMSGDFDDALGLIRTQELLASDRYINVDQMFGTEVDFGFSKAKEEAFARWTHERVLYDAVRAVRLYRPLVLISTFSGGPTDGHGQHQVAGEIAQEVFTAAADPTVFPEMGLEPWAPLKVYARVPFAYITLRGIYDYATNQFVPLHFCNFVTNIWSNELPTANVFVHEGNSTGLLGMSYVQFARKALEFQKTQISRTNNNRLLANLMSSGGPFDVGYRRDASRVKTAQNERTFFDGIDTSLPGIATLAPSYHGLLRQELKRIDQQVAQAVQAFSAKAPDRCAPPLREGLSALDQLISTVESPSLPEQEKADVLHELRVKRVQFNDALVEALGLRVEARIEGRRPRDCSTVWTPGCAARVLTKIVNEGKLPVMVTQRFFSATGLRAEHQDAADESSTKLNPGSALSAFFEMSKCTRIVEETTSTVARPYFTRTSLKQAYYDLRDPELRLAPETPASTFWVRASYEGVSLVFGHVVSAPKSQVGEPDSPLEAVPSLSISVTPSSGAIPLPTTSFPLSVEVRTEELQPVAGRVHLLLPAGWRSQPLNAAFVLHHPNEKQQLSFRVMPANMEHGKYTLTAVAQTPTFTTHEGFRRVGYPGLIPTDLYSPATYTASLLDVKVAPGLKVAYLPGTGDEVQRALEDLGVHVTTLTVQDVMQGKLDGYDVVVLGVQAYSAHTELAAANRNLLAYARAGGVLIAQYERGHFDYGPYPLSLGVAEKVVEETAPVRLLMPHSPLLNWPNRITETDFDGWEEERGHGFMASWDQRYQALLETHDLGQKPQKGALLLARTGKGTYVYVALALYRELPRGVPGAYRLLANLLSVGKASMLTGDSAAH